MVTDYAGDIFSRISLGFQDRVVPTFNLDAMIRLGTIKLHTNLLPYVVDLFGRNVFPALRGSEKLSDPAWLTDDAQEVLCDCRVFMALISGSGPPA